MRKRLVPRSGHKRLSEVRADAAAIGSQLPGIEIIGGEAAEARKRLRAYRAAEVVKTGDFFEWWSSQPQLAFDAVAGNMPMDNHSLVFLPLEVNWRSCRIHWPG